jgi:hypothetical protein
VLLAFLVLFVAVVEKQRTATVWIHCVRMIWPQGLCRDWDSGVGKHDQYRHVRGMCVGISGGKCCGSAADLGSPQHMHVHLGDSCPTAGMHMHVGWGRCSQQFVFYDVVDSVVSLQSPLLGDC